MIGEIDIDQFALMRSCWSKLKCGTVKGESVPQIPTDLIRAIRQWKVRKVDAIWSLNVWCETKLQLVASELETGKSVTDDVIVHVTKVDGEEEEEEVEEEEERERLWEIRWPAMKPCLFYRINFGFIIDFSVIWESNITTLPWPPFPPSSFLPTQ